MTARQRSRSGRTTPKGTQDPNRSTGTSTDGAEPPRSRPAPGRSKVRRPAPRVNRPLSHHRGNR